MEEKRPKITADVQRLIDMDDEMIYAKDIAPILHMKPDVIIKYAKDGTWNQDDMGKFILSGDRVKFLRLDFLQKCGFVEKKPDEPTERQLLEKIWEALMDIRILLMAIANEKPPAAATADGDPGIREKGNIL